MPLPMTFPMARPNNRRRVLSGWPTRQTLNKSLGHTVGQPRDYFSGHSDDPWESIPSRIPVRPLIRTVLENSEDFQPPPRRGKRQSPTVAVRATFRSSGKATRSPFLNATMVTPELTERAIICAKRNIRKEVLFATKRTGKGSRSTKRTPSKVRC